MNVSVWTGRMGPSHLDEATRCRSVATTAAVQVGINFARLDALLCDPFALSEEISHPGNVRFITTATRPGYLGFSLVLHQRLFSQIKSCLHLADAPVDSSAHSAELAGNSAMQLFSVDFRCDSFLCVPGFRFVIHSPKSWLLTKRPDGVGCDASGGSLGLVSWSAFFDNKTRIHIWHVLALTREILNTCGWFPPVLQCVCF